MEQNLVVNLTPSQAIQAIRAQMGVRGWNQAEVARRLGLSPVFVHNVLHERRGIPPKMQALFGLKRCVTYQLAGRADSASNGNGGA